MTENISKEDKIKKIFHDIKKPAINLCLIFSMIEKFQKTKSNEEVKKTIEPLIVETNKILENSKNQIEEIDELEIKHYFLKQFVKIDEQIKKTNVLIENLYELKKSIEFLELIKKENNNLTNDFISKIVYKA